MQPNTANARHVDQLKRALAELLGEALRRGFFGTVGVEVSVQDGTIQVIRRRLERIEKPPAVRPIARPSPPETPSRQ